MKKKSINNMVLSSLFLALGLILPSVTGHIPEIGRMLCPMHFPVILCGFLCGWQYGLIVGFICPIFRSFLFGMPMLYPMAIGMAFELATYGAVAGLLSKVLSIDKYVNILIILIITMVAGRVVWGIAQVILLGINGEKFTFEAFIAGAILGSSVGIVLQIIIIPPLVMALKKVINK